jgi:hypothetical protein
MRFGIVHEDAELTGRRDEPGFASGIRGLDAAHGGRVLRRRVGVSAHRRRIRETFGRPAAR